MGVSKTKSQDLRFPLNLKNEDLRPPPNLNDEDPETPSESQKTEKFKT